MARRQAELRARVGEHLDAGESFLAAVWVARDSGLPLISRITSWQGAPQGVLGLGGPAMQAMQANPHTALDGPEGSTAAALDRHFPHDGTAAALALTDTRLLLLSVSDHTPTPVPAPPTGLADRVRRLIGRGEPEPLPLLVLSWHCPRAALSDVGLSDPEGHLSLRFADGSGVSVVAPAMLAAPFAEAARPA
ncbi:hypothetical protein [Actinoplanes sp. HUAS TT8]|uniref:hypothetical protein n=1 Tax=Actinoplanes sp. HUAS TT8 TaxID=3447453 RepID=UPI003F528B12